MMCKTISLFLHFLSVIKTIVHRCSIYITVEPPCVIKCTYFAFTFFFMRNLTYLKTKFMSMDHLYSKTVCSNLHSVNLYTRKQNHLCKLLILYVFFLSFELPPFLNVCGSRMQRDIKNFGHNTDIH